MFLKHRLNHNLVELLNMPELWNPFSSTVLARYHAGEELQEPELFGKVDLLFPSGEPLPQCWIDPHYHDHLQQVFDQQETHPDPVPAH